MFGSAIKTPATVDKHYKDHLNMVTQTYNRSHAQKMALNQIVVDAVWSSTKALREQGSNEFDVEHFLTSLLEHLMVYGYALFRVNRRVSSTPEIADNSLFYIESDGSNWRPRLYKETAFLKNTKWHLVILDAPTIEMRPTSSPNKYMWVTTTPQSAAARAALHALSLDELILHRRQRNMYNSQPTMFLCEYPPAKSDDKSVKNVGWKSTYMFEAGEKASTLPSFQETLQRRLQRLHALREHDQKNVVDQVKSGNAVGSVPTVPGGLQPTRDPLKQAHAELLLSSGYDHAVSRHLEGDQHEATVSRDLTYAIYDAYRVPPGKFGLNRNTERMAGNLIISQQPIQIYSRYVTRLVNVLNACLLACDCKFALESTPDPSIISSIAPMLTPEAVARLYGRAHNIDEANFDLIRTAEATAASSGKSHEKQSPTDLAASKLTDTK